MTVEKITAVVQQSDLELNNAQVLWPLVELLSPEEFGELVYQITHDPPQPQDNLYDLVPLLVDYYATHSNLELNLKKEFAAFEIKVVYRSIFGTLFKSVGFHHLEQHLLSTQFTPNLSRGNWGSLSTEDKNQLSSQSSQTLIQQGWYMGKYTISTLHHQKGKTFLAL